MTATSLLLLPLRDSVSLESELGSNVLHDAEIAGEVRFCDCQ